MEFRDVKYSPEHTWVAIEGNIATIGISDFAQSQLGEIVYADLPTVGSSFDKDEIFGSVEAVKTVSDLFMPLAGTVVGLNESLLKVPTLINTAPFDEGWLIKAEIKDVAGAATLLSADMYKQLVNN